MRPRSWPTAIASRPSASRIRSGSTDAQLAAEQARVAQRRALYELRRSQADALKVRAGLDGVLQQVPVEVGQRVAAGHEPGPRGRSRAGSRPSCGFRRRRPRTSRSASAPYVDTRNGVVEGRVARIDPAAQNGTVPVDVSFTGALPRGARPDLSVDGTVELERLENVLYVGRPAFGQEQEHRRPVQGHGGHGERRRRRARAGEAGPQLGEHHRDAVGPERRRPRGAVGHVGVGRVRSRPAAVTFEESEESP